MLIKIHRFFWTEHKVILWLLTLTQPHALWQSHGLRRSLVDDLPPPRLWWEE